MLSQTECFCVTQFFEDYPTDDLISLASLISKHNLKPNSRQDAIDIICQHSECIETVLEKKKISKKHLCHYLHKNKVSIVSSWDKPALIRKLLEFWNITMKPSNDTSPSQNVQDMCSPSLQVNSNAYYEELTTKFSEWFYSLMNDENLSDLRPEHFFVDSKIKLALHKEHNTDIVEADNSTDAAQILHELQSKYHLKFLPNLSSDAMKYQTDIHGQIMLFVSGTLHSHNNSQVVGLFEQMFLLIRDVSDHQNWKIKNSQIILRSMNNAIECSSENTQNMLSIIS